MINPVDLKLELQQARQEFQELNLLNINDALKANKLIASLKYKLKLMNDHDFNGYPGYKECIAITTDLITEMEYKYQAKEGDDENSKKDAIHTNFELLIVLNYLIDAINEDVSKTKKIELLYYLRKQKAKTEIKYTSEYKQLINLFGNDISREEELLKKYGKRAAEFLYGIGLETVAGQIKKDITNY
jgi:hypothetical protein